MWRPYGDGCATVMYARGAAGRGGPRPYSGGMAHRMGCQLWPGADIYRAEG